MRKILSLFLILILVLCSCAPVTDDNQSSQVDKDVSDISEDSTVSLNSNQGSDAFISESYSYEEFCGVYPELLGEWKISEFCAHSKTLLHTAEYLMNNAVGEVLRISKDGVVFSGVCYSPRPNFNIGMLGYSKLDICTHGGYLEVDKVPLEDGVSYEYFTIFIDNSELESSDEQAFGFISFCKIDEDTLFLGIDDVYFVAECCSNDD